MRFRWLAVFPVAWGVTFLVLAAALSGVSSYGIFLRTEIELVKILALLGSWGAALAFEKGEYMRRAWFLIGAAFACFLLRDLTLAPWGFEEALGTTGLLLLRGALSILGNLSQVVGTWMLARVWKVSGLSLPGQRSRQILVLLGAMALAAVFAGPAVVEHGGKVLAGGWEAIPLLASALGDAVVLCLIAPLLLTALALHGGYLEWVWGLLTASSLAWLLYDGVQVFGPNLGLSTDAARVASELFRALGCTLGFSAGVAQRWIVVQVQGLTRETAEAGTAVSAPRM
ncbi:MAG TPA: hypothetical protein VEL74_19005 [Thermoanaerobaculia bacterium]|nr:hypothetical protein [Thermoanaerobaculia bacterium]